MTLHVEEPHWGEGSVSLGVRLGHARHEIAYSASGLRPVEADFAFAAALVPAMTSDALELESPVSPRLLATAPLLQDVFADWSEALAPVPVIARSYAPRPPTGRGSACFFSGGVDSFYSVLTNHERLTHLVFLHGFDMPLDADPALRRHAVAAARAVSDALELSLVEVELQVRHFSDQLVPWWTYYVSVMASVAHLLGNRFARVLVPAGGTYSDPVSWSHPLLDPLWSTESVAVVNDGARATRLEKLRYLAGQDLAMRWLRVCWENPGGAYNCGVCEKCLRTMVGLRAVGALERCATLPSTIDPAAVATMDMATGFDVGYARENRTELERRGSEPELVDALVEAEMRSERSYPRAVGAERRAVVAEQALADLKATRRFRAMELAVRPLDRARAAVRRARLRGGGEGES